MIQSAFRTALRPSCRLALRRTLAVKERACFSTYFTSSHEWVAVEDGIGTVGISDFAQRALGDVVYVELPEVGDTFDAEDAFGSVESVKAASDVYLPIAGEVVEVNDELGSSPNLVNESPEADGWFVKIKVDDPAEVENLMDASSYEEHISNE